jgi:hypothetical protein
MGTKCGSLPHIASSLARISLLAARVSGRDNVWLKSIAEVPQVFKANERPRAPCKSWTGVPGCSTCQARPAAVATKRGGGQDGIQLIMSPITKYLSGNKLSRCSRDKKAPCYMCGATQRGCIVASVPAERENIPARTRD